MGSPTYQRKIMSFTPDKPTHRRDEPLGRLVRQTIVEPWGSEYYFTVVADNRKPQCRGAATSIMVGSEAGHNRTNTPQQRVAK